MIIDVEKSTNDNFYKEILNVAGQYRQLVADPKAKLRDGFRDRILYFIISVAVLGALLAVSFIWLGTGVLTIVAIVILSIDIILSVMIQVKMNKIVRQMKEDRTKSQIALDEEGIEVKKDGKKSFRLKWNEIAAMRTFDESFCMITKTAGRTAMVADKKYAEDVQNFIRTLPNVQIEIIDQA